jgi:cation diffusion facilitator family transporter
MFVAGALFAIGYGIYQLLSAPESTRFAAAYITLAIAGVAEGASWMRAVRQTRHEAREADLALLRYVRSSRDPNVKMVLFEDTAALIGIALALVGIVADQVTGSTVFDPAASIAIGVLLVGVAGWMGHDTAELLIGGAARPDERKALWHTLEGFDQVDAVVELLTMTLGPNSLLVAARIDLAHGLDEDDIEQLSDEIDKQLSRVVPDVTEVFLDATTSPRGVKAGRRS